MLVKISVCISQYWSFRGISTILGSLCFRRIHYHGIFVILIQILFCFVYLSIHIHFTFHVYNNRPSLSLSLSLTHTHTHTFTPPSASINNSERRGHQVLGPKVLQLVLLNHLEVRLVEVVGSWSIGNMCSLINKDAIFSWRV